MHPLLRKLEGGDRRSIGNVGDVVEAVRNNPSLLEVLIEGLVADSPLIRMRAADAAEKVTAEHREYLQPFKKRLILIAGRATQQEVKWHLAQMLPRMELDAGEKKTVVNHLFDYLNDRSKIVVTFALQALADFADEDNNLRPRVIRTVKELVETGSPAIKSRGRKLLGKLCTSKPSNV
jgi:hypothetical protein